MKQNEHKVGITFLDIKEVPPSNYEWGFKKISLKSDRNNDK